MKRWTDLPPPAKTGILVCIAGLLGSFLLPWASFLGTTIYGFSGAGWLTAPFFGLSILLAFVGRRWLWLVNSLLMLIALGIGWDQVRRLSEITPPGIGLIVTVLAALAGVAVSIVVWVKTPAPRGELAPVQGP